MCLNLRGRILSIHWFKFGYFDFVVLYSFCRANVYSYVSICDWYETLVCNVNTKCYGKEFYQRISLMNWEASVAMRVCLVPVDEFLTTHLYQFNQAFVLSTLDNFFLLTRWYRITDSCPSSIWKCEEKLIFKHFASNM